MNQGRKQSQWVGIIDKVNIFENLGKAAALPVLPLITPQKTGFQDPENLTTTDNN